MMRRVDIFSLGVSLPALYGLLFFAVPFFSLIGARGSSPAVAGLSFETALLVVAGLAGFVGGYCILPARLFSRAREFLAAPWDQRRAWWVIAALALLGLAGKIFRIAGGGYVHIGRDPSFSASSFASLAGYLDWVALLALGMALLVYFSLREQGDSAVGWWKFIASALFALEFFYMLFSCGRKAVFGVILVYLLVRWYARGIEWWKVVLALALTAAVVFPFGNVCRNPLKLEVQTVSDVPAAAERLPALVAESFVSRMNFSKLLTEVRAHNLADFKSDFVSDFIVSLGPPQFLWAEKPASINARGNEFGHKVGILSPGDHVTAVSPLLIGELLINFGFAGVVAGMVLLGILAKALYASLVGGKETSLTGTLAYSVAWIELMRGTEGWIAPLFAGLVKLLVLILVIHFIVRKRPPLLPPASP